jgi:hypothetical protein
MSEFKVWLYGAAATLTVCGGCLLSYPIEKGREFAGGALIIAGMYGAVRLMRPREEEELSDLPEVEQVAALVHESWMKAKAAAGVASYKLGTTGEELMVTYDQLSEQAKDLDRATVKAVYDAIEKADAAA